MTRNVLSRDTISLLKDQGGLAIPHVKLKCKALFIRQQLRSITGNSRSRNHIDFWLGTRLRLPLLTSTFYHLEGRVGNEIDCTPKLFQMSLKYISKAVEDGILT